MKLTTKMRYATRAMLELALHEHDNQPLSLHDIAHKEQISIKYLEVIVSVLRSAGYIHSVRGSAGGYTLARPSSEISLSQLYELFEGSEGFVACTTNGSLCERNKDCAAQTVWSEMYNVTKRYLESVSLTDLVTRARLLRQQSSVMYDI